MCHPEPQRSGGEGARGSRRAAARGVRVTRVAILLALTACSSPEAIRTRGDGPGADVRNWGKPVELHAGAQPYHKTPCVTEPVECNGPPPVFGPTPAPD
jgi:hypothetical protein